MIFEKGNLTIFLVLLDDVFFEHCTSRFCLYTAYKELVY